MTIEDLLAAARTYLAPQHVAKIVDAYELTRRSAHGSATVQHSLANARLLAEMRIDVSGILASLLYPLAPGVALDAVRTQFGEAVGAIIAGVTNFDALLEQATRDESPQEGVLPSLRPVLSFYKRYQNSDAANKLLLAMAEEPYIVILKIADSLHTMRSLEKLTPQQQRSTVSDAHHIYVPRGGSTERGDTSTYS
jgi:GTP diphosphokinase / guanosine-3',5'-bis(diphosphate) 3'-diphosphatase